jgi:N-acyl homoserine lactone hydrolase
VSIRIQALQVGELVGVPAPATFYFRKWGETYDLACTMFVIEGASELIVVDTGTPDPEFSLTHHGYTVRRPAEQDPAQALRRLGIDPADVTVVVNTHLHWDHCGNNALFPNARFFIQRAELHYAVAPLAIHKRGYQVLPGVAPGWMSRLSSVVAVDGEHEILPEVRLVPLPGHTPGSQGVLVQAGSGQQYLIAGDCVDTYENWAGDAAAPHIPSGVYTNLIEHVASLDRIDALGCAVIPSHDYQVTRQGVFS